MLYLPEVLRTPSWKSLHCWRQTKCCSSPFFPKLDCRVKSCMSRMLRRLLDSASSTRLHTCKPPVYVQRTTIPVRFVVSFFPTTRPCRVYAFRVYGHFFSLSRTFCARCVSSYRGTRVDGPCQGASGANEKVATDFPMLCANPLVPTGKHCFCTGSLLHFL